MSLLAACAQQARKRGAPPSPFVQRWAQGDGSNGARLIIDGPTSPNSGDSQQFSICTSFQPDSGDVGSSSRIIQSASGRWRLALDSGRPRILIYTNGGSALGGALSNTAVVAGQWYSICAFADTVTQLSDIWVNEALTNGSVTTASAFIGTRRDTHIPSDQFDVNGKIGAVWHDRSNANFSANLSSFVNGSELVDWGADGSTPTGSQPDVCLYYPSGNELSNVGSLADATEFGTMSFGDR